MYDRQHRLPARWHLLHDRFQGMTCSTVFRLKGVRAGVKRNRRDWRKAEGGQQNQKCTRKNQHGQRPLHTPAHVFFYNVEKPIVTDRRLALAHKEKQDRAHEEPGEQNANRDKDAKLRKTERTTQNEGEETDRRRQRTEKDGASEPVDRRGDGCPMRFAVAASLLIAAENQNGKIDAQPNQNGAESDRHHV